MDAATRTALEAWGFDDELGVDVEAPARVVAEHKGYYEVVDPELRLATLSGRILHEADDARGRPAVGDWVEIGEADDDGRVRILRLLPRRSALVRRAAGPDAEPQVIAANVDTVGVVTGLDGDLNVRRLERYLAMLAASGAEVVIVLTKSDLVDDPTPALAELEPVVGDVPVLVVSNRTGEGLDAVADLARPGRTLAFVGSSGVGKSTLVNRLAGEDLQATADTRDDGRGRHTTIRRELLRLPGGALLLDTPGIRELQLWIDAAVLDEAFPEIAAAAEDCRFADCRHESEPGCAVDAGVADGTLDPRRVASWHRLRRELEDLEDEREQRRRRAGEGRRRPRRGGRR